MTMVNEIYSKLDYLKLKSAKEYLRKLYLNENIEGNKLKLLNDVLDVEVNVKEENNKQYNIKIAGFPFLKTINDFDFEFQPSISKDKINAIIDSNFYNDGTNVIFTGNPGTGKTHLSISIGYEVAIKRNSVYFIKFNKLIYNLRTAYNEGTLEKKLKLYYKYKLLIIDEVGFSEISELEAKLFFQLIDRLYTKRSNIITSNISFDKWPKILGNDEMITKAILDRLLHFSYLFNISGQSYRIKDKLKLRNSVHN